MIARTPTPPYYAVIFTTERRAEAAAGYEQTAARMEALAAAQPGYLGIESIVSGNKGITVSYWQDEAAMLAWKAHAEHLTAQSEGKARWYQRYEVRVARVERAYGFGARPPDEGGGEPR